MVHNNRIRGTGVWYAGAQHPHVHLQIMEKTTVDAFFRGFNYGDVSRGGFGFNVPGRPSGTGCRQGGDVNQLRMLRSWITR